MRASLSSALSESARPIKSWALVVMQNGHICQEVCPFNKDRGWRLGGEESQGAGGSGLGINDGCTLLPSYLNAAHPHAGGMIMPSLMVADNAATSQNRRKANWRSFMPTIASTLRSKPRHKVTVRLSPDAFSTTQEDVVMVAPITNRKNNRPARLGEVLLPSGTGGPPRESFALCYQVRSLDKSRLGHH